MISPRASVILLATLIVLAGCKPVRSQLHPPRCDRAAGLQGNRRLYCYRIPPPNPAGGGWQPASPSDGMLRGKWWEIYQDPQLNQLEERICRQQPDAAQRDGDLPRRPRPGGARPARTFFRPSPQVRPSRMRSSRPTGPSPCHQQLQLQRPGAGRPGKLGAGFLGPHPAQRRSRQRQRRRPAPPM